MSIIVTQLLKQHTIPSRRWMRFLKDLRQFLPADMDVYLSGGDAGMVLHFLFMSKVCAVLQHGGLW